MKLLLDTHIIIWSLSTPDRLSKKVQEFISNAEILYVSAASIWEIGIKIQLGKLQLDLMSFINEMQVLGVQELPITWAHAQATKSLPLHHRDPFDRLLIAQAMNEPLQLLTSDSTLIPYSKLIRHTDSIL